MAINPMQRRSRNMFLLGFIIALMIGAGMSYFFYSKMKTIKTEKEAFENAQRALQKTVYYTETELKSGEEIILSELEAEYEGEEENDDKIEEVKEQRGVLVKKDVQTDIDYDSLIDASMFKYDYVQNEVEDKYEKINEDSTEQKDTYKRYYKKIRMKIDVPAGTIITKDMIEEVDEPTTSDQRLQEYNMIILPTYLKDGDYIDIRLQLPGGDDYIVVSKKRVVTSTADTIWLKMREDEILTLGNAIVESYIMKGTKLYATLYTEPGRQKASEITYLPGEKVANLIISNPNIIDVAKRELRNRYDNETDRNNRGNIESKLGENSGNTDETVAAGFQQEVTKMQSSRQQYVQNLQSESSTVEE